MRLSVSRMAALRHGRFQSWVAALSQEYSHSGVSLAVLPLVSPRHLPDSGLSSAPLDSARHCCAPVPLQLARSISVPLPVPLWKTSTHLPAICSVPLASIVTFWVFAPLQVKSHTTVPSAVLPNLRSTHLPVAAAELTGPVLTGIAYGRNHCWVLLALHVKIHNLVPFVVPPKSVSRHLPDC